MAQCPHCLRTNDQVKNGKTVAGSQLYRCKVCKRKYTPEPQTKGYDQVTRQRAIRLALDENSQRQAARHAGVSHGSLANWLKRYADELPATLPIPDQPVEVAEQDELFTFLGEKKTKSQGASSPIGGRQGLQQLQPSPLSATEGHPLHDSKA